MKIDTQLIILALKKTILAGASVHLAIIAFQALRAGDLDLLNIYNILDFDFFRPSLAHGVENFICSWAFITAIFMIMLLIAQRERSSQRENKKTKESKQ